MHFVDWLIGFSMTSHALCAAGGPQADCSWVKAEETKLPLLSGSALELPARGAVVVGPLSGVDGITSISGVVGTLSDVVVIPGHKNRIILLVF